MSTAPITQLQFFSIQWDNSLAHVPYFGSVVNRDIYFDSKVLYGLTNATYQVIGNNFKIRVDVDMDDVISGGWNYVRFTNQKYGYFYGWIIDIEYGSLNSCHLICEIDPWTTFIGRTNIMQCFVEREHVTDDTIGANTVIENIDTGKLKTYSYEQTYAMRTLGLLVLAPPDGVNFRQGWLHSGVATGLCYYYFDNTQMQTTFREWVDANPDLNIVNAVMIPDNFVPKDTNEGFYWTVRGTTAANTLTIDILDYGNSAPALGGLDGYIPKNNKLYTYPFNYFLATNLQGESKEYRYEYFDRSNIGTIQFEIACDITTNPTAFFYPRNYSGQYEDKSQMIKLGGFPSVAASKTAINVWSAQNGMSNMLQGGGAIASFLAGIFTGNPLAIAGGVAGVAKAAESMAGGAGRAYNSPDLVSGASGAGGNVAIDAQDFATINVGVKYEHARRIDSYFEKYGYAVNTVKMPNISTRPAWNFVKCVDSVVTGNYPLIYRDKIRDMLDNGVTFWKSPENIGNYSLNNH